MISTASQPRITNAQGIITQEASTLRAATGHEGVTISIGSDRQTAQSITLEYADAARLASWIRHQTEQAPRWAA